MKANEKIIKVYEIKGNIDLAKVRIMATNEATGEQTFRTGFATKASLPEWTVVAYHVAIEGDALNPQIEQIEARSKSQAKRLTTQTGKPHYYKPVHGGYPGEVQAPKLRKV